jgi:hypothetical protein
MRGFKLAAIAIGAVLALIFVFSVVGFIVHMLAYVAIAALVVGGAYVAFKLGRASNRQVSNRSRDRESEVQDRHSRPLPRADVQQYVPPTPQTPPAASRPVSGQNVSGQNVDDELARLKREMGS